MKRISLVSKGGGGEGKMPRTKNYAAFDDDSAKSPVSSSPVYMASMATGNAFSDAGSIASSMVSDVEGHMELDESMNSYLKDGYGSPSKENLAANEVHGIANTDNNLNEPTASRPGTNAPDASGSANTADEEKARSGTKMESENRGVLSWYRRSSRRSKRFFFLTFALLVTILVIFAALDATRSSHGNPRAIVVPIAAITATPTTTGPAMAPSSQRPPAGPTTTAIGSGPVANRHCVDAVNASFLVNGQARNCAWLAKSISYQIIFCTPSYPVPYNSCNKTCTRC
jgi:hypothetical protein